MGLPVYIEPSAVDETLASILAGGQTGLLSPISFCHWQAPEVTTIGETLWATAFKAAEIAIAVYNAAKQQEIAEKQLDLAESWYDHANYKWNRFNKNYRPLEEKLLNEVSNTPIPKLNCADAEKRAENSVYSAYNIMDRYFRQQTRKYMACVDDSLVTDMNINRSVMFVDSRNYNYADDRWYKDFKDDKRWSRRSDVLNLGRNLDSMAKSYGQIASNLYGAVGQQMNTVAGTAMHALGYFGARNDTYSPHTYLGTAGQGVTGGIVKIGVPGGITPAGRNPTGNLGLGTP